MIALTSAAQAYRPATSDGMLGGHNAGLDALKGLVTLLVVFHHTAITYGATGGWYYHEVVNDHSRSTTLLIFFCTLNQAWFMGLFFLLAGYFTPASLERKGTRKFVSDRLVRLGLPLLVYLCLIGPATIALAATARDKPFWPSLIRLWHAPVFENGPLWFAQALLIFSLITLLAGAFKTRLIKRRDQATQGRPARPFPSKVVLWLWALLTGALALLLRIWWPVGVNVWGLQLGYFASYGVLFAAGLWAAPDQWLERLPADQVRYWGRVARWVVPVLPVLYFAGKSLPVLRGETMNVAYAFWEPLITWGIIMRLLTGFQTRFRAGFAHPHGLWASLSQRAFAIYVIHPPVLVAVALALRGLAAPALIKFLITGTLSCLLCYLVAGLLLSVPGIRKVL